MSACKRFYAHITNPNTASKKLRFAARDIARMIIAAITGGAEKAKICLLPLHSGIAENVPPHVFTESEIAEKLGEILKQIHIPDYVLARFARIPRAIDQKQAAEHYRRAT